MSTTAASDSATRPRRIRLKLWAASVILFLPFYYPILTHYLFPPEGAVPSGFIHPDMPSYVANAREHFDDGEFRLTYGLPYSPFYNTPRVYFQPQSLVLAALLRLTDTDPAIIYLLFGIIAGVVCCRLALALFEQLFGLRTVPQWLAAVGFVWGGGLLVAMGFWKWLSTGKLNDLFAYDPGGGLWFLNLGRNLLFSTEAYYHAIWLGAILCLLRRRYGWCLALVALASASHPFTGLQLLAVLLPWAIVERFWAKTPDVSLRFVGVLGVLLVLHLAYYRWFLGLWLEHSLLEEQWISLTQDWTYDAQHFIPANALVAMLAAWRIRTPLLARTVFSHPFARLLAIWFVVSFALANNELVLRPNVQPLHFTRGYDWMPLYILGAPTLIAALQWLLSRRQRLAGIAGTVALMALLVSDNAVFLATYHARTRVTHQMWLTPGFHELAAFLSEPEQAHHIVLTPVYPGFVFNTIPYLVTVYTPLRAWQSHPYNTPRVRQRHLELVDLFTKGEFLPLWATMDVLVVIPPGVPPPAWLTARNGERIYEYFPFAVYRIRAHQAPAAQAQ